MKKLLAILGTLTISISSSSSVIACQTLNKVSKVSKEVKSLAEVFSYYGRALILNQEENINLNYTMDQYKGSKADDLLKNYKGNSSTSFNQVLNSTFGKGTNFNNFINDTNGDNNVKNNKGSKPQSSISTTFAGLVSTALIVFGGGFNQRTASTLTTILTSDAIGSALGESAYKTISGILSISNINVLNEIFDFSELEGKTQQFAIHYSINQITLALARLTKTSIQYDGKNDLTSTTPINKKGDNATTILTNIINGLIDGSKKISLQDGDLIYIISKIGNALLVILKHLESYSEYCNLDVTQVTDSDHIFSQKDKNLVVLNKVRNSNFDASGHLDFEKISNVLQSFFPDPETDVNGYGLQKLFSILLQVEDKKTYTISISDTIIGRGTRVAGFTPIINALANSIAKIASEKANPIVNKAVNKTVTCLFDSLSTQGELIISSNIVKIINGIAPGLGTLAANNVRFIYQNLWSGKLIPTLFGLLKLDIPSGKEANFANLRSLLSNKISEITEVFKTNLPLELIFLQDSRLTDIFKKFANNYNTKGKSNLNINKIKNLLDPLKDEYFIYNALDQQINDQGKLDNNFKVQTLPALIKLNMNKGWYLKNAKNPGSKILVNDLLGMPKLASEGFVSGSFYEKLEDLLKNDKSKNDYTANTIKDTMSGLQYVFEKTNKKAAALEKDVYLPLVFSNSFKFKEISARNYLVGERPEIDFVLRYDKGKTSSRGAQKQYVDYRFVFIQRDPLNETIENSSLWTIKSIHRI
ncbi:MOLPALP family lipoprotein [Spiroplasma alleghenense]|uniref:MOLPALP family lipoprotein n=1 Tax=Spiroplasma alleghenense TaxID=216931 RepID=A0A345Z3H1_9MOLU|nr:MOLPALP family lipoprotein [Spiroplasma alleghenense]AXK51150.1 hypothetical protein SALLE_v1c04760 [Spiroplasma alleghenense]